MSPSSAVTVQPLQGPKRGPKGDVSGVNQILARLFCPLTARQLIPECQGVHQTDGLRERARFRFCHPLGLPDAPFLNREIAFPLL
jgi:hypothetical protein